VQKPVEKENKIHDCVLLSPRDTATNHLAPANKIMQFNIKALMQAIVCNTQNTDA
jgi:hypothetical protein